MVSIAHPDKYYQLFLSQGLGVGIGTGLVYIPSLAVQVHHWKRYRPLAMGVVITGMNASAPYFSADSTFQAHRSVESSSLLC
jgi:hypothetical protein